MGSLIRPNGHVMMKLDGDVTLDNSLDLSAFLALDLANMARVVYLNLLPKSSIYIRRM